MQKTTAKRTKPNTMYHIFMFCSDMEMTVHKLQINDEHEQNTELGKKKRK
jgi:hypothetical protein